MKFHATTSIWVDTIASRLSLQSSNQINLPTTFFLKSMVIFSTDWSNFFRDTIVGVSGSVIFINVVVIIAEVSDVVDVAFLVIRADFEVEQLDSTKSGPSSVDRYSKYANTVLGPGKRAPNVKSNEILYDSRTV